MIVAGSYIICLNRKDATDGVDTWRLPIPMNGELFDALDRKFGERLRDRGYSSTVQNAPSALTDRATRSPLGRRLDIQKIPASCPDASERFRTGEGPAILLSFRLAGKPGIPSFLLLLENVTGANHQAVLRLQKDLLVILEELDYRSYQDRSWP